MTIYYVRKSGSDAAAGTSAGAAWATIGKALTGGMASGDTVYIGAGIYREAVTVTVAPTGTTNVIGDVDGSHTGDAGEVRWTAKVSNLSAANATPLNNNSKNFFAYSNIVFQASGASAVLVNLGGHDNSFTDCAFFSSTGFAVTATVNVALNLTFDRCYFFGYGTSAAAFTLPTSASADYDVNVLFRNCLILWLGACIQVTGSGANSFKGGGVNCRSCTIISNGIGVAATNSTTSTTFPVTVYDCIFVSTGSAALSISAVGQMVEDYNYFWASTTTNFASAAHSNTLANLGAMFHIGHERIWGGQPRPFGSLVRDDPGLGWGALASPAGPSVDMLNRPRPSGVNRVLATGTATSGAATTLTDSGAAWGTNQLVSAVCKITGGTGSGQTKVIKSNTGTALTFYGNWKTNPDNTSTYAIYFGSLSDTFTCTSGSTTTAVQSSASWVANMWAGFVLEVTAGTGAGRVSVIASNTGTTLTLATGTALDSTSQCVIYKQTSVNAVSKTAGCFERHDTAEKETTTTDAGSVAIRLTGWTDHAIYVPVDATATTISVRAYYDANHAATNKPQAILDANGEIGVTTETKTMTVAAGNWETLTFAAQTPSAKGWVTIRLVSRSDAAIGKAFFDTLVAA